MTAKQQKLETKTSKAPEPAPQRSSIGGNAFLSADDLKVLRNPFPKESLGVKVQSYSKDRTRAMLVLYLQHTDVMDRLEQVDPAWTSEVTGEERSGDTVYVRIRLTLKGVSRENVGEGGDPKAAYSDALKRAAMLFGVGRYLYDSITVWADYNDQRDRFRSWSIADYEKAARGQYSPPSPTPVASTPETEAPAGLTTQGAKKPVRSREHLNRVLMNLYRPYLTKFPETRFVELLQSRYNVGETRLMTLEQIEDLVQFMEQQLASAA